MPSPNVVRLVPAALDHIAASPAAARGSGFAIPSNVVRAVAARLLRE